METPELTVEQLVVQCKVCAGPIYLDLSAEAVEGVGRDMCMKLAEATVHNGCQWDAQQNDIKAKADAQLMHSMENWKLLCPPMYQSSAAFIERERANPRTPLNIPKIDKAQAWEYGEMGLFIFGSRSGTGKTTTGYEIIRREMVESGRKCVAITHTAFARKATEMVVGSHTAVGGRWVHLISKCDILFIDDFGKSRFTTADGTARQAEEFLFDLIDARISGLRPIILTSNDNAKTIKERMSSERGEAMVRRLKEFFFPVNFDA